MALHDPSCCSAPASSCSPTGGRAIAPGPWRRPARQRPRLAELGGGHAPDRGRHRLRLGGGRARRARHRCRRPRIVFFSYAALRVAEEDWPILGRRRHGSVAARHRPVDSRRHDARAGARVHDPWFTGEGSPRRSARGGHRRGSRGRRPRTTSATRSRPAISSGRCRSRWRWRTCGTAVTARRSRGYEVGGSLVDYVVSVGAPAACGRSSRRSPRPRPPRRAWTRRSAGAGHELAASSMPAGAATSSPSGDRRAPSGLPASRRRAAYNDRMARSPASSSAPHPRGSRARPCRPRSRRLRRRCCRSSSGRSTSPRRPCRWPARRERRDAGGVGSSQALRARTAPPGTPPCPRPAARAAGRRAVPASRAAAVDERAHGRAAGGRPSGQVLHRCGRRSRRRRACRPHHGPASVDAEERDGRRSSRRRDAADIAGQKVMAFEQPVVIRRNGLIVIADKAAQAGAEALADAGAAARKRLSLLGLGSREPVVVYYYASRSQLLRALGEDPGRPRIRFFSHAPIHLGKERTWTRDIGVLGPALDGKDYWTPQMLAHELTHAYTTRWFARLEARADTARRRAGDRGGGRPARPPLRDDLAAGASAFPLEKALPRRASGTATRSPRCGSPTSRAARCPLRAGRLGSDRPRGFVRPSATPTSTEGAGRGRAQEPRRELGRVPLGLGGLRADAALTSPRGTRAAGGAGRRPPPRCQIDDSLRSTTPRRTTR